MLYWLSFYGAMEQGNNSTEQFSSTSSCLFMLGFWLVTSTFAVYERLTIINDPLSQLSPTLTFYGLLFWMAFLIIYLIKLVTKMINAYCKVRQEDNPFNQMRIYIFTLFSTSVIIICVLSPIFNYQSCLSSESCIPHMWGNSIFNKFSARAESVCQYTLINTYIFFNAWIYSPSRQTISFNLTNIK